MTEHSSYPILFYFPFPILILIPLPLPPHQPTLILLSLPPSPPPKMINRPIPPLPVTHPHLPPPRPTNRALNIPHGMRDHIAHPIAIAIRRVFSIGVMRLMREGDVACDGGGETAACAVGVWGGDVGGLVECYVWVLKGGWDRGGGGGVGGGGDEDVDHDFLSLVCVFGVWFLRY